VDGSAAGAKTFPILTGLRDMVIDPSGVYWMHYRATCLVEEQSTAGSHFKQGIRETVVLHLPTVF